jgi:hypothetical protein
VIKLPGKSAVVEIKGELSVEIQGGLRGGRTAQGKVKLRRDEGK